MRDCNKKQSNRRKSLKQMQISTLQLNKKAKKEIAKEKQIQLKQAQHALNRKTRALVLGVLGSDIGNDESLSESQESNDDRIYKTRNKKRLQDEKRAKENDIAAFKQLIPACVRFGQLSATNTITPMTERNINEIERFTDQPSASNVDQETQSQKPRRGENGAKGLKSNENKGVCKIGLNFPSRDQLFGSGYSEQMCSIGCGIFCKTRIAKKAVTSSKNPRQCSRKLLTGVFTLESILNCTLTGRRCPTSNRRKESNPPKCRILHGPAIRAIIKYSKKIGKKRKWPEMTTKEIKAGLRRKICFICSEYRLASQLNEEYVYGDY